MSAYNSSFECLANVIHSLWPSHTVCVDAAPLNTLTDFTHTHTHAHQQQHLRHISAEVSTQSSARLMRAFFFFPPPSSSFRWERLNLWQVNHKASLYQLWQRWRPPHYRSPTGSAPNPLALSRAVHLQLEHNKPAWQQKKQVRAAPHLRYFFPPFHPFSERNFPGNHSCESRGRPEQYGFVTRSLCQCDGTVSHREIRLSRSARYLNGSSFYFGDSVQTATQLETSEWLYLSTRSLRQLI